MTGDLRYSFAALRGDYIRAAVGAALCLAPAFAIPLTSPADGLLLPAAGLFLIFGVRTWQRQASRVVVDSQRISIFTSRQASLDWRDVRSVRLSYFSTRADRREGWMQLTLKGVDPQRRSGFRTIRVDSALDDFERVAGCAAAAVRRNRLAVSRATRANFDALGIDLVETPPDCPEAPQTQAGAILREPG